MRYHFALVAVSWRAIWDAYGVLGERTGFEGLD